MQLPFFERDFEPCKHIWAAALKAEQHGYLRGRDKLSSVAFHSDHQPSGARSAVPVLDCLGKNNWSRCFILMALAESRSATATAREFLYIVDGAATASADRLVIEVAQRELRSNGTWGKLKTPKLRFNDVDSIPNTEDRRIIAMLVGSLRDFIYGYSPYYQESVSLSFHCSPPLCEVVLPLICATGRSLLRVSNATDELPSQLGRWRSLGVLFEDGAGRERRNIPSIRRASPRRD